MKYLTLVIAGLIGLGTWPALAQTGPLYATVPTNTCPSAKPLKLVWIANEVASDGAAGPGPGYAETMVVCHSTMKTGTTNIDVWVELFDFGGNSVGTGAVCDLKPGNTAPFITGPPIPPYIGAGVGPALVYPPGSLRVMATKPKVVCDVTLYDTGGAVAGLTAGGPLWSKDVTVTKAKAPQKGD